MADNKFPKWPLYLTLVVGFVISLLYSFGPLSAATGKHKTKEVGPYKIEFSNRGSQDEGKPSRLTLLVTSDNKPKEVKLAYYALNREEARPTMVFKVPQMKKEFTQVPMQPAGDTGFYTANLMPLKMSEQYYFYFVLTDDKGVNFAYPQYRLYYMMTDGNGHTFTYPDTSDNSLLEITYRREGDRLITVLHITMMFMVIFFMLHVLYYSMAHIAWSQFPISKAINSAFWANLFFFITSFPIGCYVAWKAYGRPWTGIPEVIDPNDVDNKSLIIFVYWVIILILIKGVGMGKNKISSKVYAWLSLVGAIATLMLFVTGGHI